MDVEKRQLIKDYIPLAKSICKKFPNLNYQDRYSEALYGLVVAANKFDFENYDKNRFPQYARTIIKNKLKAIHNSKKDCFPVDWAKAESSDEKYNSLTKYLEHNDEKYYNFEAIETCRKILNDEKFAIAKLLMEEYTQEEIAEVMELSQSTVSRRITNIKEEIYEYF